MKNEYRVFENEFLNYGISMVACENEEAKTTIMTYLLYEYGIENKREVLFYTFAKRNDYYYRHLLSRISKIDKRLLVKYLYPWMGFSHYNTDMINRFYFVSAIEKIQQSNLFMIGETKTFDTDYLDNILEMLEFDTSQIIIIEDFDLLLKKTKYSRKETLRKLKDCSLKYETNFILFSDKKEFSIEETNINEIIFVSQIGTSQKQNRILNLKKCSDGVIQKQWNIEYNRQNYEIEKREEP